MTRKTQPTHRQGDRVALAPCTGRKVLNPATGQYLPENGERVTLDRYWLRLLRDGDVCVAPATKTARPSAKATDKQGAK